ncbi:MAG: phosphoribosylglycinamide formyltransferase [Proteobacteria bacterium]|nr:phosphoribosylglycinamide formyltransferase [Pseudomonadota bacterium]
MNAAAPARLVILISGRGSNMVAIVRACQAGAIAAHPVAVISDRPEAQGLASAAAFGLPALPVARAAAVDAAAFEATLAGTIDAYQPQFIALAGFMRILSAGFVERYAGRMFNIHPSLLPAYRGLHTHARVLAAHERWHGASVHFVTPQLDSGPVVLQSRLAVRPGDTEESLSARVQASEHIIYPRVLSWFASGRLTWQAGGAWLDGAPLRTPLVEDFDAGDLPH